MQFMMQSHIPRPARPLSKRVLQVLRNASDRSLQGVVRGRHRLLSKHERLLRLEEHTGNDGSN